MNILIIGSGAREHAIAWKVAAEQGVKRVYVAPGNPGTARFATNLELRVDDLDGLLKFALAQQIDLTIVGPELPLSLGICDRFREKGLRIFGPSRAASQLESSKSFAKSVMLKAGVRTARAVHVHLPNEVEQALTSFRAPLVLKADGLASGKGVVICQSLEQARSTALELLSKYPQGGLVIEEFLEGVEASFIVATDGFTVVPLSSAHDYKRVFDRDQGPNTGGMGSVSPTPRLATARHAEVMAEVIRPVLREMRRQGNPFQGFLYAGLMIAPNGEIAVLEFNARLGDPETQAILRRLRTDLSTLLFELAQSSSDLEQLKELEWDARACVCVVLAAQGYPDNPQTGTLIEGVDQAEKVEQVVVFHAGTRMSAADKLLSAGGRVLSVTALGKDSSAARASAYAACEKIHFEQKHCRTDVGLL